MLTILGKKIDKKSEKRCVIVIGRIRNHKKNIKKLRNKLEKKNLGQDTGIVGCGGRKHT